MEKITVDALLDKFLATRTALSPTTAARYRGLAKRIHPHLGSKLVAKVRPTDFAALYTALQTTCRICSATTEKPRTHTCVWPLSSTSVRHVHNLLHAAFAWGTRMNVVSRNPLDTLTHDAPQRRRPQVDAYSDAEVVAILDAARGSRWEAAIKLALATGMRRGELAALRWEDVALDGGRGTMTVRRAFVQVGRDVILKDDKDRGYTNDPLQRIGPRGAGDRPPAAVPGSAPG